MLKCLPTSYSICIVGANTFQDYSIASIIIPLLSLELVNGGNTPCICSPASKLKVHWESDIYILVTTVQHPTQRFNYHYKKKQIRLFWQNVTSLLLSWMSCMLGVLGLENQNPLPHRSISAIQDPYFDPDWQALHIWVVWRE